MTHILRSVCAIIVASALSLCANAQSGGGGGISSPTCPKAPIVGAQMVTNVPWREIFPIRIGPALVGGTRRNTPDLMAGPYCTCPGKFGYPSPGIVMSMWSPDYMLETVKTPYCSPAMGGVSLASASQVAGAVRNFGGYQRHTDGAGADNSFRNFHEWWFPTGVILNRFVDAACTTFKYDLDLAYLSELDPTFTNDQLANLTTPEAVLFTSPPAVMACAADAIAASTYKPIEFLPHCVGSWGQLFPYTGNTVNANSAPRDASLAATRGLAMLHRRGLMALTHTNAAVCAELPWPTLPKQQYRMATYYPVPERSGAHWLGASTLRWGEWRNIPVVGEDFLFTTFVWKDCCATFY